MSRSKKANEADIVLDFLAKGNRPFSVQNIVDALQKDGVKKTAVERSLASLVESGQVNKKEYGKAKIFLLAQDRLQLPDEADKAATDARLRTLTDHLKTVQEQIAQKRERVALLKQQYTMNDAEQRVSKLQDELTTKLARKDRLGDGASLMSKEDKLVIEKAYFDAHTAWKKYQKLIKEISDQIGEATGKRRADLYEDVGIETDADAGINLADFPDIDNPHKPKRGGATSRTVANKRQRQS